MYQSFLAIGLATLRMSGLKAARGVWRIGTSRISSSGPLQSDSVDHVIGKCCRREGGTQTSEWRSPLPFWDAFFARMYTAPTETIDHLCCSAGGPPCNGPNNSPRAPQKHP